MSAKLLEGILLQLNLIIQGDEQSENKETSYLSNSYVFITICNYFRRKHSIRKQY